jgi:hypothetical protein
MEVKNSAPEVRYKELNKVDNLWWWSSLWIVIGYLGTRGDIYVLFVFTIFFKHNNTNANLWNYVLIGGSFASPYCFMFPPSTVFSSNSGLNCVRELVISQWRSWYSDQAFVAAAFEKLLVGIRDMIERSYQALVLVASCLIPWLLLFYGSQY